MPIVSSDGVDIYHEVQGEAPPIMFVHGPSDHAAWWQQVAALRDRFTIVTMDLRCFGNSDSSMPEFDDQYFATTSSPCSTTPASPT